MFPPIRLPSAAGVSYFDRRFLRGSGSVQTISLMTTQSEDVLSAHHLHVRGETSGHFWCDAGSAWATMRTLSS